MVFKIIKTILLGLITISLYSCDPPEAFDFRNDVNFKIKNYTQQKLVIKTTDFIYSSINQITQDSIISFVHGYVGENMNENIFNSLYDNNRKLDDTVWIYSENNELLKTWVKYYPSDSDKKEFFRGSDWTKKQWKDNSNELLRYYEYTFEITDEDLK
jgi:hypothetical protein